MLVREVHHRIKNNLQGVAGLMQQIARARPEVAGVIAEVVGQVQAIAQVYGLQVGSGGPLRVASVVEAIAASVQRTFGREIATRLDAGTGVDWTLPEAESIPIALTLNELLTNAVKHSRDGDIRCVLACGEAEVSIVVANRGRLPEGFNVGQVPGGVSGLGLVRALLPRRSATLALEQQGGEVVARVTLVPPGITALQPL
jgi:two-component sensor histidine kinase